MVSGGEDALGWTTSRGWRLGGECTARSGGGTWELGGPALGGRPRSGSGLQRNIDSSRSKILNQVLTLVRIDTR